MIVKQTVRIKAPVTSNYLEGHIDQLKCVNGEKKRQVSSYRSHES